MTWVVCLLRRAVRPPFSRPIGQVPRHSRVNLQFATRGFPSKHSTPREMAKRSREEDDKSRGMDADMRTLLSFYYSCARVRVCEWASETLTQLRSLSLNQAASSPTRRCTGG